MATVIKCDVPTCINSDEQGTQMYATDVFVQNFLDEKEDMAHVYDVCGYCLKRLQAKGYPLETDKHGVVRLREQK